MLEIKKINARDLVGVLNLFESEEEKQQFIQDAEDKGVTYSITIEIIGNEIIGDIDPEVAQNTIWEDKGHSSNEIFFNVYLDPVEIKELKECQNKYGMI